MGPWGIRKGHSGALCDMPCHPVLPPQCLGGRCWGRLVARSPLNRATSAPPPLAGQPRVVQASLHPFPLPLPQDVGDTRQPPQAVPAGEGQSCPSSQMAAEAQQSVQVPAAACA